MTRTSAIWGRGLALSGLLLALAFVPASASANCSKVSKLLTQLGKAKRTARDPSASTKAMEKADAQVAKLEPKLTAALGGCDWVKGLARHPALTPFRDAMDDARGTPLAEVLRSSWLQAELGLRQLLPDDDLCLVATRTTGGPKGRGCFKTQDKGLNAKNLTLLAKGWCVARKSDDQSQQAGIDTNKLAGLFEVPGLPTGFVGKILDQLAQSACPGSL